MAAKKKMPTALMVAHQFKKDLVERVSKELISNIQNMQDNLTRNNAVYFGSMEAAKEAVNLLSTEGFKIHSVVATTAWPNSLEYVLDNKTLEPICIIGKKKSKTKIKIDAALFIQVAITYGF